MDDNLNFEIKPWHLYWVAVMLIFFAIIFKGLFIAGLMWLGLCFFLAAAILGLTRKR